MNGVYYIKGAKFDQYYGQVEYKYSCSIMIDIGAMHIPNNIILDVSNALYTTNVPINERVCVSTPPYYMEWFEKPITMFLSIGRMAHFLSNV